MCYSFWLFSQSKPSVCFGEAALLVRCQKYSLRKAAQASSVQMIARMIGNQQRKTRLWVVRGA
jgi:hypothetical protein